MKYLVTVGGYVAREVEVEADSPREAVREARERALTEVLVLQPEFLEEESPDGTSSGWFDVVGDCFRCGSTILQEDGAPAKHSDVEDGVLCEDCTGPGEGSER